MFTSSSDNSFMFIVALSLIASGVALLIAAALNARHTNEISEE